MPTIFGVDFENWRCNCCSVVSLRTNTNEKSSHYLSCSLIPTCNIAVVSPIPMTDYCRILRCEVYWQILRLVVRRHYDYKNSKRRETMECNRDAIYFNADTSCEQQRNICLQILCYSQNYKCRRKHYGRARFNLQYFTDYCLVTKTRDGSVEILWQWEHLTVVRLLLIRCAFPINSETFISKRIQQE